MYEAKKVYKKACIPMSVGTLSSEQVGYLFGNCNVVPMTPTGIEKEKEETMSTYISATAANGAVSDTAVQREYLRTRLRSAESKKYTDLRQTFGLDDDAQPKTGAELKARLAAGKYVVLIKDDKDLEYRSATSYIRWRDPAVKEDQAGYDAAVKLVDTAYTAAKDQIVVGDAKEGLAALQAFEAKTFSAAAS